MFCLALLLKLFQFLHSLFPSSSVFSPAVPVRFSLINPLLSLPCSLLLWEPCSRCWFVTFRFDVETYLCTLFRGLHKNHSVFYMNPIQATLMSKYLRPAICRILSLFFEEESIKKIKKYTCILTPFYKLSGSLWKKYFTEQLLTFFKFDMETWARKLENKHMLQKTEQCLYNGNWWLLVAAELFYNKNLLYSLWQILNFTSYVF